MGRVAQDLRGQLFGKLTPVERLGSNKGGATWLCQCECGNTHTACSGDLKSGKVKSCGCLLSQVLKSRFDALRDDMIGRRFGRLRVANAEFIRNGKTYYSCICDCSNRLTVVGVNLKRGYTQSCGCYANELSVDRNTTHGLSYHPLYTNWRNMISRCYNPDDVNYRNYGARGIQVCEEWRYDPTRFIEWGMNNGYRPDLTIERKENHLGYFPSNCTWIPRAEQARNRRNNVIPNMEVADEIRRDTRSQWDIARDHGTSQSTVSSIKRHKTWT